MSPAPRREGTPARQRKSRKGRVVWTPQVESPDADELDASAPTGLKSKTQPRTRTRPPVRRRRRLARTLAGYASSLGGLIVIAILVMTGVWAFQTYGPFAPPPPLTDSDKTQLGAKYQQIAENTNAKESELNVRLGNFEQACQAGACPALAQFRDTMNDYYNAENEYLQNLQAVDWRGARTEANTLITALKDELTTMDKLRNVKTQDEMNTYLSEWGAQGGKRDTVLAGVTALRQRLGIPAPTATPTPVLSPCASESPSALPSGSAGASGSPAATGSGSASPPASPSAQPSGSASESPAASGSAGASGSPSASGSAGPSATPAASPTLCITAAPSASESAGASAGASGSAGASASAVASSSESVAPSPSK